MRIFCPAIVFSRPLLPLRVVPSHTDRWPDRGDPATGCELLVDLGHSTGADGPAALPDGEAQALLHRDRLYEPQPYLEVISLHNQLHVLWPKYQKLYASRREVEQQTNALYDVLSPDGSAIVQYV